MGIKSNRGSRFEYTDQYGEKHVLPISDEPFMLGPLQGKRKIKKAWTCSDFVHHEHRTKFGAWVCGLMQRLGLVTK
jgi:hypothetical protein